MKKVWNIGRIIAVLVLLLAIDLLAAYLFPEYSVMIAVCLLLIGFLIGTLALFDMNKKIGKIITGVSKGISTAQSKALGKLAVPVLITSDQGEIVWYNPAFETGVPGAAALIGKDVEKVFGLEFSADVKKDSVARLEFGGKVFTVTPSCVDGEGIPLEIYYFFDITELDNIAVEYKLSRPVVCIVAIDSLDELTKSAKDSETVSFRGEIQKQIEGWFSGVSGICRRTAGDRYLIVIEDRYFDKLSGQGFDILDRVRQIKFGDGNATLSIGVGRGGSSVSECAEMAVQALDMAFGRGGDQAVVKLPDNNYKFYGGVSGALEMHNKVRARIISNNLKALIAQSGKVLLMGHKFSDLDSVGSCIALRSAARLMGLPAYIVVNKEKTMASSLIERTEQTFDEDVFITGEDALGLMDESTLLIVTDVHRPSFLDYPEVYEKSKNVVVIDHHRKAVDFISNSVLFYHETAVSSTCEMVTELLQYMSPKSVTQPEAEALLSGIMLDSKNFVLNSGVRTFEAAAFLRNRGADPVKVKRLFAGSMDIYKMRADIVSSAMIYDGDCAVAICKSEGNGTRIASSQAADELLGIEGILASFVLCKTGNEINISARSLGMINVQLVMELLSGGGHRTMAACQVKTEDFAVATEQLKSAIDEYKKIRKKS